MLLYGDKRFVNKRPGYTLCIIGNGSLTSYKLVNKLACLSFVASIETTSAKKVKISNNAFSWFLWPFKCVHSLVTHDEKRLCLTFKGIVAHLMRRHAFRTSTIASALEVERLIRYRKLSGTLFVWKKVHVPNKLNEAKIRATIKFECATHRNCFQLVLSYMQCKIGPRIDGHFSKDKIDNFRNFDVVTV